MVTLTSASLRLLRTVEKCCNLLGVFRMEYILHGRFCLLPSDSFLTE
ncbi:MAG: hypothetical protein LBU42_06890 [Prevotellaceae bacterium]|nr:hypothetical protein [Prevotellaceae bacterium]